MPLYVAAFLILFRCYYHALFRLLCSLAVALERYGITGRPVQWTGSWGVATPDVSNLLGDRPEVYWKSDGVSRNTEDM